MTKTQTKTQNVSYDSSGRVSAVCFGVLLTGLMYDASAHPPASERGLFELDTLQVLGRANDLTGIAESASRGQVGIPEFEYRPLLRAGELLEVVPGLMATQHSGTGKANQYFLRGFNLDHGTDFSAHIDGVPLNLRTHGHGQGYLDLNSMIPEFVETVEFGKGPYYAEIGDFSSAGYAQFHTVEKLPQNFVKLGYGQYQHYRLVAGHSRHLGESDVLAGLETRFQDGPWDNPEKLNQYNGLLKYTQGGADVGFSVIATAYSNRWNASDQIPRRAIEQGLLTPRGTIDFSDGGQTERYSLALNGWRKNQDSASHVNVYALYSNLDLFSNFTFFLDDPEHGDQIHQQDRRVVAGGDAAHTWQVALSGLDMANTLGLQVRHDHIPNVALHKSQTRQRLATVSAHQVDQTSVAVYGKNESKWLDKLRTLAGARADFFVYDIRDQQRDVNSGTRDAAILSPKFSIILGPWHDTEYYINFGYGYHSNDARGVTLRQATDGTAATPVDPLVASRGVEVGLRNTWVPGLTSTLALWWLQLDSELVFVGDAGTTEPSGHSERHGIEWTHYYRALDWLTLDADLALTDAWFSEAPQEAQHVPNAVGRVLTTGATAHWPNGWFGALRLRHFGDVPLTEDGAAKAEATTLVNFGTGYQYANRFLLSLDILNLLGSHDADITYFYASRLPGEAPEGVADYHYHPVEPRTFRVALTVMF